MVSTKPAVQFNYYCCRVSNLFLANGAALWVSRSPLGYKKHHSHSPPWELWFAIKPNRERPGHSLSIGLLDLVRSDQGKLRDQVVWVSHLVVVSRLIGWAWIHVCCLVWTDLAILQKPIIGPFSLPSKGQAAPHLSFLLWKDVIAFLLLLLPHMPSLVRFKR